MSKKSKKVKLTKFVPRGHAILILAAGGKGKSHSLRNLRDKRKSVYLNTDAKPLPFFPKNAKDTFGLDAYVRNYKDVLRYLKKLNKRKTKAPTNVIIDTMTHLMGMFALQNIA